MSSRIHSRARAAMAAVCAAAVLFAALPAASQSQPPQGVVIGLLSEPPTLNPLAISSREAYDIVDRMFIRLLEEQGDFHSFAPRLAEQWVEETDGSAVRFWLRKDVRWQDGKPVTARDVRFTWELQTDTTVAWAHASKKELIDDVEVVDDYTVVFHFKQPSRNQLLDVVDGVILPEHILGGVPRDQIKNDPFGRNPVGNGPYRLKRWEPGQYIELEGNPAYYEGAPKVDRVIFRFVPDMVTLLTQLEKGEIDVLESVPPDKVPDVERNPALRVMTYPSRRMTYIVWNNTRVFFQDHNVRRALTAAIDRQEIIKTVWQGYAVENRSPMHPILWAYDRQIRVIDYDPGQVPRMLRSANWWDSDGDGIRDNKDRKPFVFELLVNNNQQRIDIATIIRNDLQKQGIRVNLRVLDFNTYVDRIMKGDFDAAYVNWKTDTRVDMYKDWHSESIPPDGYNFSRYSRGQVDGWIEKARVEMDAEKERDLWWKCQAAIYEDQPCTFLTIPQEITAISRRFCNVQPNAISFFSNLRYWRVAPDCE